MRTALITLAAGRHTHLLRQHDGVSAGSARPDRYIVVAMGDPGIARLLGDRAEVIEMPVTTDALPLAHARNTGANAALAAGAELLVFLDVDCIPGTDMIARYQFLAAQPVLGDSVLCGPVTYLPPAPEGGYRLDHLVHMTDPHAGRPVPGDEEHQTAGDHRLFWSLSFAVRARTWRAVGGFCEHYTGYGAEDTDFGQLARAAGIDLTWVGGAHAYHQHHPSQDPPVEHLDDIVANATTFHRRWGWWPMPNWLHAFARQGLAGYDPAADRWFVTAER